jgi:hypothetical protein
MLALPSSNETFIIRGNAIGGERQLVCLWVHVVFPFWMSHVQVSVDGLIVSEHFTVKNNAIVWVMQFRITYQFYEAEISRLSIIFRKISLS